MYGRKNYRGRVPFVVSEGSFNNLKIIYKSKKKVPSNIIIPCSSNEVNKVKEMAPIIFIQKHANGFRNIAKMNVNGRMIRGEGIQHLKVTKWKGSNPLIIKKISI